MPDGHALLAPGHWRDTATFTLTVINFADVNARYWESGTPSADGFQRKILAGLLDAPRVLNDMPAVAGGHV